MNKIYLKAVAFGLVFALAVFFVINQIDSVSIGKLEEKINSFSIEAQESKIFFQVLSQANDKEAACVLIKERIDRQFEKNSGILASIDEVDKSVFLQDSLLLKKTYALANTELYFLFRLANESCNENSQLILFFYKDKKPLCADCIVQGKILDGIRQKCINVRSFAFPADLDFGTVELFRSLHGVTDTPAVVVNESKVFNGLVSEQELLENLDCRT